MRVVAAVRRAGAASLRKLTRTWRRSLQFRVVATTLLLGLLVLGLLGTYLYRQVGEGLVEERRVVASAEALQLTKRAQLQFNSTDLVDSQERLTTAARGIIQEQAGTERSRYVVLSRLDTNVSSVTVPVVLSGEVGLGDVPEELQEQVAADASTQHEQIAPLKLSGQTDPVASWVIGQQVELPRAGMYGIYFVYPMERERDSLAVVGRTFLFGGLVLMVLIGVIAYVVTRLVVTPVRSAAVVAERLASGHLDERMVAHGEDDLATLATSFNEMADGLQRQIGQLEDMSRVQQRFVSDVSHELRTPLTTIRMAADVIHDARGEFAADRRPVRRAAARRARPVRGAAGRPARDQPVRRRRGRARRRARPTCVGPVGEGRRRHVGPGRAARQPGHHASTPVTPARRWSTPAASSGSCATSSSTRIEHGEGRPIEIRVDDNDTRSPCRSATSGRACGPARRPWCSTGSGGPTRRGPGPAAEPGSAWRSPSRTPGCTTAGCRPGAHQGRARASG